MSFDVDDEAVARGLATALSQHGFTRVDGYPNSHGGWRISVFSYGPPRRDGAANSFERAAVAIARPFRGRRSGVMTLGGPPPAARTRDYPIMLDRPGVRPPVPVSSPVATPPEAEFAWVPDLVVPCEPDLSGLDRVDWAGIDAVFGNGAEIPVNVRLLLALGPDDDWETFLGEDVFGLLANSGDLWESAALTIPFLAEIARCSGNPRLRRELIGYLVWFAGCRTTDLITDADDAAIEDRAPVASSTASQAHAAVGAEAASLLATWALQPPAVRIMLAQLAALYPSDGRGLRAEIEALASSVHGSGQEVILRLVVAMVDERHDEAMVVAELIGSWRTSNLVSAWLDAPGISDRIRAEHALTSNPVT